MEKKYFIIHYSEDGKMASRVSPLWDYSRTEKILRNFSDPFYEIGNTEDDEVLAKSEIDCWIELPEPRF